jgi:hypothetical protein
MKKFTIIAVLALLVACGETEIHPCMKSSHAQPIEFYPMNKPTYNEKTYPGVFKPCYCSPWLSSSPLTAQVYEGDPDKSYALLAYDESGAQIGAWMMAYFGAGNYSVTIVPANEGLANRKVSFGIGESLPISNENASFTTNLDGWIQVNAIPTAGANWVWDAGYGGSAYTSVASKYLAQDMQFSPGTYRATWGAYMDTTSGTAAATVYFFNAAGTVIDQINITGSGNYSGSEDFQGQVGSSLITRVGIRVSGGTWLGNFFIKQLLIVRLDDPDYTQIMKSDCFDIRDNFDDEDLVVVNYANDKPYAGLFFTDTSPLQPFQMFVPGEFWDERNTEETMEHELSNSQTIALSSETKEQKLLYTDHLPHYRRRKLLLALKMNNVLVDGEPFIQKEAYTVVQGANKSAERRVSVWLTRKDFVQRNVV